MAEVKILIEGYAKKIENGWLANSTVALIKSNDKNIIVDPGCNRSKLIEALSKNDLKTSDIDFVLLTHTHTDHALLAGIFENAKVLNDTEVYDNDNQIEHNGKIPGTDLEIIPTPGHDQFHCSLIVNDNKLGKVVVAGDLFWWRDDEEQETNNKNLLNHEDPYVKDKTLLKNSRKKVLVLADYIIPGHGKMWKVEK